MRKIAVCWPRFGPYHIARLDSLANNLAGRFRVVGIETNPSESTYGWNSSGNAKDGCARVTVSQELLLEAAVAEYSPDVIFVNGWGYRDSRRLIAWAMTRHIPIVVFSDSRRSDRVRNRMSEWLKRRLVSLCSAAVVAGPDHKVYLSQLGMPCERIFTGLDVVDNSYFSKSCAKPINRHSLIANRIQDAPYFLFVGRFVDKKNLLRLVDAFKKYRSQVGNIAWNLVLVGEGELKTVLEMHIRSSDLDDSVIIIPFQQYAELPSIYYHAACFVLPSDRDEQWGLVVNEAMACGRPVLVSDACGCVPSLVYHDCNGYCFNPTDVGDIADILKRFSQLEADVRCEMGLQSSQIISHWDLSCFSDAVQNAAQMALDHPKPITVRNKATLFFLKMHNRVNSLFE